MIAVIAGATGLVGSELIKALITDSQVAKIISVSRKPLNLNNTKIQEVLISDLANLSQIADQLKGDLYFCALGTTIKTAGSKENFRKVDYQAVVDFGQIAKGHNAKSFVLISAMGANSHSKIFYNQVKGDVETKLKELNLRSLIIFQPALLIGERKEFRFAEMMAENILKPLSILLPSKWERSMMTNVSVLALAMVQKGKSAPEGIHTIKAPDIKI